MSIIPREEIDRIIDMTDIVAVIEKHVQIKKSGTDYKGLCPFHTEKTPSFTVSPRKQFYHCFGCGAHGSVITFMMAYSGLNFIESIEALSGRCCIDPRNESVYMQAHSESIANRIAQDDAKLREGREKAAQKARAILVECEQAQHAYLDSKGFPALRGAVYRPDTDNLLVVPMYTNKRLVGCQKIDIDGDKKVLYRQQVKGTEFVLGRGDLSCWCEGYATGLSIHAAMKQRLSVHVCFTAGNLAHMAKQAGTGFVVADNDASQAGEKAAKATGLPYYMPEVTGEDFNDEWKRIGTFQASQRLKKFLMSIK